MTAPNELSFLPDDYLEQKWKRRANLVCAVLVILAAGAIGAVAYVFHRTDLRVQARFEEVTARYNDAARKIEQVKKMHEQQRQVVHHAELAQSLVEKVPRSNMLAEITNCLPNGVSLLEMMMNSSPHQGPAPTGSSFEQHKAALEQTNAEAMLGVRAPQFDVKVKITGVAQNDVQVAQTMSRLSHSKIFQDVNLVVSDTYDAPLKEKEAGHNEALRKWQIEMMLNPAAEVTNDTKTAAVELSK